MKNREISIREILLFYGGVHPGSLDYFSTFHGIEHRLGDGQSPFLEKMGGVAIVVGWNTYPLQVNKILTKPVF